MIISIEAEKAFDKIQYPFMIFLNLRKQEIQRNLLNLINSIYKNPTPNVKLYSVKLNAFLLSLKTRQGCLLSPLLFSIVVKLLPVE